MTRRTYKNPDPPPPGDPNAQPPPPGPPKPESKAWGFGKTLLTAGATAVAAVIAVDIYRRIRAGKKEDEEQLIGNPSGGNMPQIFMGGGGGPQIVPIPLPWPTPGMMMPQPAHMMEHVQPNREPSPAEALELQRLRTEEAKAKALNAQIEAWMDED